MADLRSLNIENYWLPMLAAIPELEPVRKTFEATYSDCKGALPEYLFASDVAKFAISKLSGGKLWFVKELFRCIELMFDRGTEDVRRLALIGYLEDMQNENLHSETRPSDFRDLMTKTMQQRWDRLGECWATGEVVNLDHF